MGDVLEGLQMSGLYASSPVAIRDDLAKVHARAWERIGRPGTWWDGAARVAIAAETRHASSCRLCRRRKEALSPAAIEGAHDSRGELSEVVVEVVHRVRNDPGRLSEPWYRGVVAAGLSEEQYIETLSVVAHVVAIDTMARGLGLDALPLPHPQPGAPSQRRPVAAKPGGAWVPWLEPTDLSDAEADLYPTGRPAANIMKAMSLVPNEVRGFFDLVSHQYMPPLAMRDFSREYRAISHSQIELLAARVSALNQCLY
jgi:hypothetical protein